MVGGSRGGEASLLAASHDPRVAAAVSVAGSGVVTPGIDFSLGRLDRILRAGTVAWTLAGDPLPALPHQIGDDLARAIESNGTVALRDAFSALPEDPVQLERISIPIERSRAAVLLTSSTSPGPGVTLQTGGDPAITTAAREETWRHTLEFLDLHLA